MRRQGDRDTKDPRVRVEAARTLSDASTGFDDKRAAAMEMQAFMDIFHPGHKMTDELVREARKRGRSS